MVVILLGEMLKHLNLFLIYFLRNPYILFLFGLLRFYYFRFTNKIKTMESRYAIKISNKHNLDGMFRIKTQFFMQRFDKLIFSMMANERFSNDSKILIIGPRSESDILKLNAYGYKNITAIDLITYTKNIKIMDAHNITFDDSSFDCIFCGWVLPYSNNPELIAKNIIKVIKNKGLVSIGIEYSKNDKINSINKIKKLFENNIENIFFEYDADLKYLNQSKLCEISGLDSSQILISFTVKKK